MTTLRACAVIPDGTRKLSLTLELSGCERKMFFLVACVTICRKSRCQAKNTHFETTLASYCMFPKSVKITVNIFRQNLASPKRGVNNKVWCRSTSNKIFGCRGESESEKTTCQDVTRARTYLPGAGPAYPEATTEIFLRGNHKVRGCYLVLPRHLGTSCQ